MPTPLLIIILPFFLLFGAAIIRLYSFEMKILKKLKVVDPNEWNRLIWLFGRAHPFRFRKFIKEPTTSDPYIKKYIAEYKRTSRFATITWAIFAIILISAIGLGMILNYTI